MKNPVIMQPHRWFKSWAYPATEGERPNVVGSRVITLFIAEVICDNAVCEGG